jgi:hypothetical protein
MVDTMVGTMGSKGNLTKEHPKAHLHFQPKTHLHSEVHHLFLKVQSPLLVVLHSHEEDYIASCKYPTPIITES